MPGTPPWVHPACRPSTPLHCTAPCRTRLTALRRTVVELTIADAGVTVRPVTDTRFTVGRHSDHAENSAVHGPTGGEGGESGS